MRPPARGGRRVRRRARGRRRRGPLPHHPQRGVAELRRGGGPGRPGRPRLPRADHAGAAPRRRPGGGRRRVRPGAGAGLPGGGAAAVRAHAPGPGVHGGRRGVRGVRPGGLRRGALHVRAGVQPGVERAGPAVRLRLLRHPRPRVLARPRVGGADPAAGAGGARRLRRGRLRAAPRLGHRGGRHAGPDLAGDVGRHRRPRGRGGAGPDAALRLRFLRVEHRPGLLRGPALAPRPRHGLRRGARPGRRRDGQALVRAG